MQKWEYARLVIQFAGGEYVQFRRFTSEGGEERTIKKEGVFREKPDY